MPKITVGGGPSHGEPAVESVTESVAEAPQDEARTDYSAMSFKELRDAARDRGLPTGGSGDDLRARLEEADETTDGEDKTHDQEELRQRLAEQEQQEDEES